MTTSSKRATTRMYEVNENRGTIQPMDVVSMGVKRVTYIGYQDRLVQQEHGGNVLPTFAAAKAKLIQSLEKEIATWREYVANDEKKLAAVRKMKEPT